MNVREQGFLLLTGYLGDPERKPLTIPQFRKLTIMAQTMEKPLQDRDISVEDLQAIGCNNAFARRIVNLLSQESQLEWYLKSGSHCGCEPLTRISQEYPHRLRSALGPDAPGTLWLKGDKTILNTPTISIVGSRELCPDNACFAEEVGRQAALQGFTLVSGNARGADRIAQEACLRHGGKVIAMVADELRQHPFRDNMLYISEEGFDLPFSTMRALQRNRTIHSFSDKTFVVQCTKGKGGTWSGTKDNLQHSRSHVFCFNDSSDAYHELVCMGAVSVEIDALTNIAGIFPETVSFL